MSDREVMVGLGEVLWDIFGDKRHIGGAPANFVYHAARQGHDAWLVSAVGHDGRGRALATALGNRGVPALLQSVDDKATGVVRVTLEGAGLPRYDIRPDAAWDHLAVDDALLALARRTRLVCFGTLAQRSPGSRAAIRAFLNAMPADDSRWRVLDINLRQHYYSDAIVRDSLRAANALKINEDELEIVARREGLNGLPQREQALGLMRAYDLRLVLLTCGSFGSHLFCADGQEYHEPAERVEVVDTVGAGDAFTATFFSQLLRGRLSLRGALRAANRAAAFVCGQVGAMPSIPLYFFPDYFERTCY